MSPPSNRIKTRFLILSDTHGNAFPPHLQPNTPVDVAIHCGDLTEGSTLDEYRAALKLLKSIPATLKIVIGGNHDFTLDTPAFMKIIGDAHSSISPDLIKANFGDFGEARAMLQKDPDITYLDEGVHQFVLSNGALLRVYASSHTPSNSNWGFTYRPDQDHGWNIPAVDVAITHGPPHGILDRTDSKNRAGCPQLFGAIAHGKPQIHCFGHIHEGWGARLITWRKEVPENPTHFTAIDNENSVTIASLESLNPAGFDTPEIVEGKKALADALTSQKVFITSHCTEDVVPLRAGEQTLFVNASIQGPREGSFQFPWVVDVELERA
ncbi:ser Thr phosphatase family [Fusarium albosuccineum]|uniref:Ser Thr phosphatase family n=1 Tax=Fusarium albosuccineum TaxID=1237068 RepID=A0A8H4L035_9HYPO|nr:ser Thr phosphatase family [Fusarium albosuccineum]